MNQLPVKAILAIAVFASCFFACKKEPAKKTTCTSTWHAFQTTTWSGAPTASCTHGTISPGTGIMATSGSSFMINPIFTSQGAYNASDNAYYVVSMQRLYTGGYSDTLYKVDGSGTLTAYAPADTAHHSTSVVYNGFDHQMYCLMNGTIAKISLSGSSYSAATVATPVHTLALQIEGAPSNIAIDNATGAMYIATCSLPTYYVEQYHTGTSSIAVVATAGVVNTIMEMRYNTNDGKLYAMTNVDTNSYNFLRIDPSAGSVTTVAGIGSFLNPDMYSATLDPCSDRYVVATPIAGTTPSAMSWGLFQFNMSGMLVETDTVAGVVNGLTVAD